MTGMRGCLLAGQSGFLWPYKAGGGRFFPLSATLRETVADNPARIEASREVDETISSRRSGVAEPTVALRRETGVAKAMADRAEAARALPSRHQGRGIRTGPGSLLSFHEDRGRRGSDIVRFDTLNTTIRLENLRRFKDLIL